MTNAGQSPDLGPQRTEVSPEMAERLATGQITLAEFAGLSVDQLYAIAEIGYSMLSSGKLDQAREIYRGLVAADPYDSVFHCHLAATLARMGENDEALKEYSAALRFNIANSDAFAGRGEVYLTRGQVAEAITDLRIALELDPDAKRASTVRAHALLLALKEAASAKQLAATSTSNREEVTTTAKAR